MVGKGILRILPADFAKQLRTMRVLNAKSTTEELRAIARFGSFFAGVLLIPMAGFR
jgi:cholesterol oxidase